jgi:Family of unknown function (DUF5990)
VLVEILGSDLPGRRCGPNREGRWYENIHVGPGRHPHPAELVPGDAPKARWAFEVTTRTTADAEIDFGGPYVYGKRGDRFLYLSWGEVADDGAFELFRAAKLRLSDVDPGVLRRAMEPGCRLVGRLGLTDGKGHPRSAGVRPRGIAWSAEGDPRSPAGRAG